MSKILFVIEFGGFVIPKDTLCGFGHEVETTKNMREALALFKKFQPDLLVAEFSYTSQFRDRDSNLDTILTWIQGYCDHTRVMAIVEQEQKIHFERLASRFDAIRTGLYFPFKTDELLQHIETTLG